MGEGYNGRRVQREKRIREQGEKGRRGEVKTRRRVVSRSDLI
jgi:hypothetical protein